MSDLLSVDERHENVAKMVHSFRLNPKKNTTAGLRQIQGTHVREVLFHLCVLYLTHGDDQDVTHEEAVVYACENVYDHLAGIGTYVSMNEQSFWRPISPGELNFVKMWFTRGVNWAEKRRTASDDERKTASRSHTKNRELVAA